MDELKITELPIMTLSRLAKGTVYEAADADDKAWNTYDATLERLHRLNWPYRPDKPQSLIGFSRSSNLFNYISNLPPIIYDKEPEGFIIPAAKLLALVDFMNDLAPCENASGPDNYMTHFWRIVDMTYERIDNELTKIESISPNAGGNILKEILLPIAADLQIDKAAFISWSPPYFKIPEGCARFLGIKDISRYPRHIEKSRVSPNLIHPSNIISDAIDRVTNHYGRDQLAIIQAKMYQSYTQTTLEF